MAHQDIINYFDKDNVQLCIIGYCTALDVNDNNNNNIIMITLGRCVWGVLARKCIAKLFIALID